MMLVTELLLYNKTPWYSHSKIQPLFLGTKWFPKVIQWSSVPKLQIYSTNKLKTVVHCDSNIARSLGSTGKNPL